SGAPPPANVLQQFHGVRGGGHARNCRDAAQRRGTRALSEVDRQGAPEARTHMIAWIPLTRSLAAVVSGSGAAGLLLKVTLLFAAAELLALALRHRAAAARHFVWLVALAGALALAVLAPVAPRLVIRLPQLAPPPAWSASEFQIVDASPQSSDAAQAPAWSS